MTLRLVNSDSSSLSCKESQQRSAALAKDIVEVVIREQFDAGLEGRPRQALG
jgi:hypothetical protein